MRLPVNGKGDIDEPRATKQIHTAIEQGVNYFDTAVPYHNGASEPFLGKALAGGLREKVFIATKLPFWLAKSRQDMDVLLASQLKNLQTDHIDYYLVHNLNLTSWKKVAELGVRDFLDQAKKDGRIRFAGFSFHGQKNDFPEIVDGYNWDFCQIQYNILDDKGQAGTTGLEYAAAKKLGIMIMEPLRGGSLTGKIPESIQKLWDEADTKRSPAEWSLRWIWNRPEITCILSGMNREEHVEENIRVASNSNANTFTAKDLDLVSRVGAEYRRLMKIPCTACQYCLPCPVGVDIPACFELYNSLHMFSTKGLDIIYLFRVGGLLTKPSNASLCVKCGKCVKKCPQSIPIPDELSKVVKQFEGPSFRIKRRLAKGFLQGMRLWTLLKTRFFS